MRARAQGGDSGAAPAKASAAAAAPGSGPTGLQRAFHVLLPLLLILAAVLLNMSMSGPKQA